MNQLKRYLLSLILMIASLQSYARRISVEGFVPISSEGFASPPHITSFTPTSGKIGDTITITGSGLNSVDFVAFGKYPEIVGASYNRVLSDTTIKVVIGDGASGNIYIYGDDGADSISGFTFIPPPPEIISFTPQTANIGAAITITGKYFNEVSKVMLGGVPADSVIILSASSMIVVVGKGASGDIVLTSPTGTGSKSGFMCLPGSPQITGFTPDKGSIGTSVTIKGQYFHTTPNKNIVYFGAVRAIVSAATDSTLTVNVPLGASHQPITVTANGLTAQASKAFAVTFAGGVLDASSFIKSSGYNIGGSSFNLLAYDLDGDLNVDLIAPYSSADGRAVLQNNGNANFGPVQTGPIHGDFTDAELADMDGDGNKDLVISQNMDSRAIGVARNLSSPGKINFANHKSLNFISAAGNRMTTGDVDGDGRPDVYVLSQSIRVARIGRNITTDTTMALEMQNYVSFNYMTRAAAICDMDGDGKRDVITCSPADGGIVIQPNTSLKGIISLSRSKIIPVIANLVWAADLDGDNKPELIAITDKNTISISKNNATPGNFTMAAPVELPLGFKPRNVAIGDLDGDGKPDLAVPGSSQNMIYVFRNLSANNQIAFAAKINYTADNNPNSIVISDLNGDGKPDIATAGSNGMVSVFLNQMNAAVQPVIQSFTPDSAKRNAVITISGKRFTGATSVTFGGLPATSFQVLNDTTITAVVANGISGKVTIVTPMGATSGDGFVFRPDIPVLTAFSPAAATLRNTVTITGKFLSYTKAVSFGGIPAQSFTIVSDSVITAIVGAGNSGAIATVNESGKDSLNGFTYIQPVPVITSFTPASATKLDTVTIEGQYLDLATSVSFGGVTAKYFQLINDSTLKAVVSDGRSGNIEIKASKGTAVRSGFLFIIPPPVLDGFTPAKGREGDTIILRGYNLQWVNRVSFGDVPAASIHILSDTIITVVLGQGGSGNVWISSPGGSKLGDSFEFIYPGPDITNFSPTAAKPGTTITINGHHLTYVYQVLLGGATTKDLNIISDSVIAVTVDRGATGSVIINSYRGTDTLSGFTYISPGPVITSLSATAAKEGETVTIYGRNLLNAYEVTFGGTSAASIQVLSDSVITAVVGNGSSGRVIIKLPVGTAELDGFTYLAPAPVISSFSPDRGVFGSVINIQGKNFSHVTDVQFGGTPAYSFAVVSDSTIRALVATGSSGAMTVTSNGGTAQAQGFTFMKEPVISSFTPTSGTIGTIVTIRGNYFNNVSVVDFGSIPASNFTIVNDSVITATVADGASGSVNVRTSHTMGYLNGFTFIPPPPIISSFTPSDAPENSFIEIRGSFFNNTTSVTFGDQPAASFTVITDKLLQALVGKGASGDITITTPSGTGKRSGFTLIPNPDSFSIRKFTPMSGATGAIITIEGRGFKNANAVSFGGVPAGGFQVMSDSVINAIVGSGGSGAVAISYTSNLTVTRNGFSYLPAVAETAPLRFFPNPASGYTWIEHPVSNQAKLYLLNLAGDILRIIPATQGSGKTQFNLSGIKPGYYYISWRDGNQSISKAIVILE
jgi:hypothetical protein